MKFLHLFIPLFFPLLLQAQAEDSTWIRMVDSLIQVQEGYFEKRDIENARTILDTAKKLATEKIGTESVSYAKCCFFIGRTLDFTGKLKEAETEYLKAKEICESSSNPEPFLHAKILNNLGTLYSQMGLLEDAESSFLPALEIRKKTLAPTDYDYVGTLVNLGILYARMGRLELSESFFLEAKEKFEEELHDRRHPFYLNCITKLGSLYSDMGKHEQAENLFLAAAPHFEKEFGAENPNYAGFLNDFANLYLDMGNLKKAETYYLQVQPIVKNALGIFHPNYLGTTINIGLLYKRMGDYEKAESFLVEAKEIFEKKQDTEHPFYMNCLANLANLYSNSGRYIEAEALHLKAKSIAEKILGKDHPSYARLLSDLGKLNMEMGRFDKAEELLLQSKEIRQRVLGNKHPEYLVSLVILSSIYEGQNRFSESDAFLSEFLSLCHDRLSRATSFLSDQELESYLIPYQSYWRDLGPFLLARSKKADGNPPGILPGLFYDHLLFYKGFLLSASSRLNLLSSSSSESLEISNRLKSFRRRLAAEYIKPIARRQQVDELEEKANAAEKELARTISGYAEAMQQPSWKEIHSTLQPREAAIEFFHFEVGALRKTDSILYAALIISPQMDQPRFVALFEEKQLDSLLHSNGGRKADYVNKLYAASDRGAKQIAGKQLSLYELVWKPLENELSGISTIYFSPSGLLHRLNLGAVPVDEEFTFSDRYKLIELGSTRYLVLPGNTQMAAKDALLYGGIDYFADSSSLLTANTNYASNARESRGSISFNFADSISQSSFWNFLSWTEKEVNAIGNILDKGGFTTAILSGFEATEESFKSIGEKGASPRILHISTHGYFFPDPEGNGTSPGNDKNSEPAFKNAFHPMIRSGLIMAGANHAWRTGKPFKPNMENGILTAYEISQMNLSNTELVVLSACETGLGDIRGNEGVYGLQRAFKIAGARYLIMSLWQVPDKETAFFMKTFYEKMIREGLPIPEAFLATQKTLRENPFASAYDWAGFVLIE